MFFVKQISLLKAELSKEKAEHKKTRLVLQEAINMADEQDARILELEKQVSSLLKLINKSEGGALPKTSLNSNLAPSGDFDRSDRKKKKKSSTKPGGQAGHKSHVLEMNDNPTKRIPLIPKVCNRCGKSLLDDKKILVDSKQEIDIPPINLIINQFDRYAIQCDCGACCSAKYPDRLRAKVQYGPRFRAFINYMHVYHFVPYKRIAEFSEVVFGIHFSQGTIFNTVKRTAKLCGGLYDSIRVFLSHSKVVGADETVIWVNQSRFYNWVWQNRSATFIACEDNRKKQSIYKYFPNGFANAILVSDRYAAHLSTPAAGHQICWPHLIRLINGLTESENNTWLHKLLNIYRRAKILEKIKPVWEPDDKKVRRLENDLNRLLIHDIDQSLFPETRKLLEGLKNKYRHALLTFLYHENVPSHNNASERAIRNAKVRNKISGQFKSAQNYYAIIRSVIDTLIKNGKPVFDSLFQIESNNNFNFSLSE